MPTLAHDCMGFTRTARKSVQAMILHISRNFLNSKTGRAEAGKPRSRDYRGYWALRELWGYLLVRFPRATRPGGLACRVWLRAVPSRGLMTSTRPPGCFAYRPVLAFWL